MRVLKFLGKHNLLIHSWRSLAGDPVQWSSFPQQQDAAINQMINIVLLVTMETPLYFYHVPSKNLEQHSWSVHSKPLSLDETYFFVWKRNTDIRFFIFLWFAFHLFWCSVAFHRFRTLSHATHYARDWGGRAFVQRKKQRGKSGIRFS